MTPRNPADRPATEPRTDRLLAREAYPSLGLEPFAVSTEAGRALIVALDDPTRRIYWDDFRPSLEDRIRRIEAQAAQGAAPRAEGLDVDALTDAYMTVVGDPRGLRRSTWQSIAAEYRDIIASRPSDERVPESEER